MTSHNPEKDIKATENNEIYHLNDSIINTTSILNVLDPFKFDYFRLDNTNNEAVLTMNYDEKTDDVTFKLGVEQEASTDNNEIVNVLKEWLRSKAK